MNTADMKALVSGGTGSIGSAIVRSLRDRGVDVTFIYNGNVDGAEKLSLETGATAMRLDLSHNPIVLEHANFDVLVNSAGVILTKTLIGDIPLEELATTLQINVVAPFQLTQAVLPHMRNKKFGRIVNVGSIWAQKAVSENGSYNISKHALLGLTRSLAKEYGADGVLTNQVDPSAVDSAIMHRLARENVKAGRIDTEQDYLDRVASTNPVGRLADPRAVASTVVWLALDADFVNGVAIAVDGGTLA